MKRQTLTSMTLSCVACLGALCLGAFEARASEAPEPGNVYAMTNAARDNAILVYHRDPSGRLSFRERVATGGDGSGGQAPLDPVDALGSQSPLIVTEDGRFVLSVNAGSDQISVLEVRDDDLVLTDVVSSGGDFPVSLSADGDLVYVLNSGGEASLSGFRLSPAGKLRPIPRSTRSLDVGGDSPPRFLVSPAQVGFDPSGEFLIVTIKGTNEIRVFPLDEAGRPSERSVSNPSSGTAPFGFDFDAQGRLLVVEPFGVDPPRTGEAGAVSSYELLDDGTLLPITESEQNGQTASCWLNAVEATPFAYVTNNQADTVTGYRVDALGRLSLLAPDGVSAHTGANPVDLTQTPDGEFLYAVNAGSGTISMFDVDPRTGALTPLGEVAGLPEDAGAVGIAAR